MNLQKRLFGPCTVFIPNVDDVKVDIDAIIWRLFLFETYIFVTVRLKEIPHLINAFGYNGVNSLLSSGALQIYCDATMPASTGQNSVIKSRREKGILPLGSYSFSMIRPHNRNKYISDCLGDNLNKIRSLSLKELDKLRENVVSAIVERPNNYGIDTLNQLKTDLINNLRLIKIMTTKALFNNHKIITHPDNFSLKISRIDEEDFRSETNIGSLYGLSKVAVHKIVEKALLALASLNQRIEDMFVYSALTGSVGKDLKLFREKFSLLAESISPEEKETQFQRIIEIGGLPSFRDKDSSFKVDIEKLLKIRESRECREFRDWITKLSEIKNCELKDHISNIKSKISSFVYGLEGKIFRFLVTTGISLLPGGIILGPALSAIDSFLLEKLLPYPGPIMFINRQYPSIFEEKS